MMIQVIQTDVILYSWTCSACGKSNVLKSPYLRPSVSCMDCKTKISRITTQAEDQTETEDTEKEV